MGTSIILACGKRRVGLPPPYVAIHAFNNSERHLEFLIYDVNRGKISTWPTWLLRMNPQFVHVLR